MTNTSEDTLDAVITEVWKNQEKDVDGEKENYLKNIADNIGRHYRSVKRAVDFLEKWGLAKTWRQGNKKCVRLTWNPQGKTGMIELKPAGKTEGGENTWNSA